MILCAFVGLLMGARADETGPHESDSFHIVVQDYHTFFEYENEREKFDWGHNMEYGPGSKYNGAYYMDVTGSMTVEDVLDKVNYNKWSDLKDAALMNEVIEWHKKGNGGKQSAPVAFMKYPLRPDLNGLLDDINRKRRKHQNWRYSAVRYCGDVLNPRSSLRSNGIAQGSILLLTRDDHTSTDFIRMLPFEYKGKSVQLDFSIFQHEPAINIFNMISFQLGIPPKRLRFDAEFNARGYPMHSYALDFYDEVEPVPEGTPEWIRESMKYFKGPFIAHWPIGSPEPPKPKYFAPCESGANCRYAGQTVGFGSTKKHYKGYGVGMRPYNNDLILYRKMKVIDDTSGCACLSSPQYMSMAQNFIPAKDRKKSFGVQCKAHDLGKKYCGSKNIDKGDRKCWCPLKWCYTDSTCGTPSKQYPGMYYSYELCDNGDALDCYTADDEGTADEVDLNQTILYNFSQLSSYLQTLLVKLIELLPEIKD